jgi:hypothetical protein
MGVFFLLSGCKKEKSLCGNYQIVGQRTIISTGDTNNICTGDSVWVYAFESPFKRTKIFAYDTLMVEFGRPQTNSFFFIAK